MKGAGFLIAAAVSQQLSLKIITYVAESTTVPKAN
jgi:hypothetical protein